MADMMKERPAHVRFEKRPIEDRTASLKNGAYTAKDVTFAIITPPGGKLIVERRVESVKAADGTILEEGWFDYLRREEREGRFPGQWLEMYERVYDRFKAGEEAPLEGTPIKDWPPLSPAQRANLIALSVLTVEDLAVLNEEGKARFGMGIVELQKKAKAWLEATKDIGGVVAQLAALQTEHLALKEQNERQKGMIEKLQRQMGELQKVPA